MYEKLSQIDALTQADHHFLLPNDVCYYFGEYTARKGYAFSKTNQLILNLKKSVDRKGRPEYAHKLQAINSIARILNKCVLPETVTFIPIPPSKCKSDPLYDNRIIDILESYKSLNGKVDYRELISQNKSTEASHNTDNRLSPADLANLYTVDQSLIAGMKNNVVIFDDILTTGSHFKAAQEVLEKSIENIKVYGLFIARRAPEAIDWDFDEIDLESL